MTKDKSTACFLGQEESTSSVFGHISLEVSLRHPGEDMTLQLALELGGKVWIGDKNRGVRCVWATSSPFLRCQSQCLNPPYHGVGTSPPLDCTIYKCSVHFFSHPGHTSAPPTIPAHSRVSTHSIYGIISNGRDTLINNDRTTEIITAKYHFQHNFKNSLFSK